MIQAVEVEAIISNEGEMTNVRLPESCKKWFGNNAKLILILQEPYSNFVLTAEPKDRIQQQKFDKWRGLLKATQSLPSSKEIDDADIAFEIESYRSSGQ
ncbi:MAG: hypothetical protein HQK63_00590 [Desulfamplus sp.]|nr:hypothetical protein [Desulfamplus sp.]